MGGLYPPPLLKMEELPVSALEREAALLTSDLMVPRFLSNCSTSWLLQRKLPAGHSQDICPPSLHTWLQRPAAAWINRPVVMGSPVTTPIQSLTDSQGQPAVHGIDTHKWMPTPKCDAVRIQLWRSLMVIFLVPSSCAVTLTVAVRAGALEDKSEVAEQQHSIRSRSYLPDPSFVTVAKCTVSNVAADARAAMLL